MNKPKMLYASPFMPLKSGISDYSVILAYALRKEFDITLYIDNYNLDDDKLQNNFKILKHGVDNIDFEDFSYFVYNIGNNPYYHDYIYEACLKHPGLVILHDVVLYFLVVGYYQKRDLLYSKIYNNAGIHDFIDIKDAVKQNQIGLLEQKKLADKLPLNEELIHSKNKIMVHSKYAYDIINKYTNRVKHINMIQQVAESFSVVNKAALFKKYNIPEDAVIITSFGIIAETKLNHIACLAISNLNRKSEQKICYIMVGDGNYIDRYVDNEYIFKTGFIDMNEFDSFIVHSDIVLNLRYPSMGETSAALVKILQMGKTCIVNNQGWFSEIPDDCVIKISISDIQKELEEKLQYYISNKEEKNRIANNARAYIKKEYNADDIVKEIKSFLNSPF